MNRNFSLLIKPASWRCNLGCPSCFYSTKSELFRDGGLRMNDEVLAALTRKFLGLGLPLSCFGWQGGECTLMGLDFFRKALGFQRKFAKPGQRVSNSIQTNATLLDDEWGRFFHENNILVGVSLDGPPEMHDRSRPWPDGHGSHADVLRGLEALRRNHAEFNVLTLVSAVNQEHPRKIYRYLKSLDVKYHQYIECVEFDTAGNLKPCSVEPRKWGRFLCELFDEWYPADIRKVSIRLFDSILSRLVDGAPSLCSMGGDCRQYFVVEHNGDLYPCDFHVSPEWKLGNVEADELMRIFDSPLYHDFGARKSAVHAKCRVCEYYALCMGCCPKNRFPAGDLKSLSALCDGWKMFYAHTLERFGKIAAGIQEERRRNAVRRDVMNPAPGRNSPCPCGSGKKYKNCCG